MHVDHDFPELNPLCQRLAEQAADLKDQTDAWPADQFRELANAGVLGWVIPLEYGGRDVTEAQLTRGYVRLAQACLTTTFILTQRNGACQRLAGSGNAALKAQLLPAFCRGESFTTVGISHLTTSRQHLSRPAVSAREVAGGWLLDGMVPWVTGARQAEEIITGGTLEDGRQLLVALPTQTEGVALQPPPELLALNASQTGAVELRKAFVPEDRLIAGPIKDVMKCGTGGGAGSLTTSALAIGLTKAALDRLEDEARRRADLLSIHQAFAEEWQTLADDLQSALRGSTNDQPHLTADLIRQRANSLVLRSTQAYLAASKGAGFLSAHPASRYVREATFFLVWSCPQPVLAAQLQEFACTLD